MEESDAEDPKLILSRPNPYEAQPIIILNDIGGRRNVVDVIIYLNADFGELLTGVEAIHVEDYPLRVLVEVEVLVQPLVKVCNEDVVVLSSHQD